MPLPVPHPTLKKFIKHALTKNITILQKRRYWNTKHFSNLKTTDTKGIKEPEIKNVNGKDKFQS